jgi:20S proteasome alpha/beta subunit
MVGMSSPAMQSGFMTCIVGITDGRTVTIGGDSAGSDGWHVAVRSDSKVFQVGPYLMGFTTSYRMGQLLRYSLNVGEPDTWDVDRFMVTTFIEAVRECLSTGGYARIENGQEQGGQFLVGIHGRLYVVGDDYQIGHTISGYAAVGSGYLVALGSLHSTATSPVSSRQRAVMALEAAAELTEGVRAPFTVVQSE